MCMKMCLSSNYSGCSEKGDEGKDAGEGESERGGSIAHSLSRKDRGRYVSLLSRSLFTFSPIILATCVCLCTLSWSSRSRRLSLSVGYCSKQREEFDPYTSEAVMCVQCNELKPALSCRHPLALPFLLSALLHLFPLLSLLLLLLLLRTPLSPHPSAPVSPRDHCVCSDSSCSAHPPPSLSLSHLLRCGDQEESGEGHTLSCSPCLLQLFYLI